MPQAAEKKKKVTRRTSVQGNEITSSTSKGAQADTYVDPSESRIGRGLGDLIRATQKKAEDQADAIEGEAKPTPTPSASPTPKASPTPPANESPLARAARLAAERKKKRQ